MSFSPVEKEVPEKKLSWTMYAPQIILLAVAFVLGVFMPEYVTNVVSAATKAIGF